MVDLGAAWLKIMQHRIAKAMNDIAVIHLTGKKGGFTIVDADLFPELNRYKWNLRSHGYVARGDYIPETQGTQIVYLHRVVNQTPPGFSTDHANGYLIDNTRRNLRSCTHAQNLSNQRVHEGQKSSKYKGVHWCNTHETWVAQIHAKSDRLSNGRKNIKIGTFKTEREAALAYNSKAKELFGEFARLNDV